MMEAPAIVSPEEWKAARERTLVKKQASTTGCRETSS
jgi:hypothetical protein